MEDTGAVLVAGFKLDRYELLAPIASGGMASVWLARLRGKRGFEKLFAIKTIRWASVLVPAAAGAAVPRIAPRVSAVIRKRRPAPRSPLTGRC